MNEKDALRIMVLDDEPFMAKLLGQMLHALGYSSVLLFEGGQAALDSMDDADGHPDLILLDIDMPGMDGVEFVRHLVGRRYRGALIVVSGTDERVLHAVKTLVQAHQLTGLGYLGKPIAPAALAQLIAQSVPQCAFRARRRAYGVDELRDAIASGALVNHYQPTVDVATAQVVGVETLVRWRHPRDGLVSPDHFIGIAEEHGLIDALTSAVLAVALSQARAWREAGMALRISVNLSMASLASLSFLDLIVELAGAAGMPPRDLVLEVTESRLLRDQRASLEILTRLRLKGFRLSIDDFGTGNASLTQLRDIPFDELKIDQSFVHGAWANETQRALFDASLDLARKLGMEAVAEGVEDRDDWDFLRRQDCKLAQGYFIARPMPAEDLPSWMTAWNAGRQQFALQ
jgi:EAL domain-containing protein (putative c-di-GMP-specific phosphodiesterase class I)/CheY-like chemotaxis protein